MFKEEATTVLTILICESDNKVLKKLESWTEAIGNIAISCDDGVVAMGLYLEHRPDIILVSQTLNSMGVIEFIEVVRKNSPTQAIIIMLNEDIDSLVFKRCIDLQVDKYLNKPIDAKSFYNTISYISKILDINKKVKVQDIDAKIQNIKHIAEINKVKDSFLTVFTHELKTPLNTIINFSEYIHKQLLKPEFSKKDTLATYADKISSAGWIMLDMINNLMDAIKLKDNKLEVNTLKLSLNMSMDDVLSRYSSEYKDIDFIKEYDNECYIVGDQRRIKQILGNLISNSVKYTHDTIIVSIQSNKNGFKVNISDNGDGFKDKKKAMNLFEQSSIDDMTRDDEGIGVGLYVVKGLCEKMGYKFKVGTSLQLGGAEVIISGQNGC